MSQVTYSKIKSYVENRLDLLDEGFIRNEELLQYTEEALRYCEAEVHTLGIENLYFEAQDVITLTTRDQDYSLPSNIYGRKITRMIFNGGDSIYPIFRITHKGRYTDSAITDRYSGDNTYRYYLINNNSVDGTLLRFHPKPQDTTVTTYFTADTTLGSKVLTSVSSTSGLNEGDFVQGVGIRNGTRIRSIDNATQVTLNQSASSAGTTVSLTQVEPKVLIYYIREVEIPTATTDAIDFPEFWNFVAPTCCCGVFEKRARKS